MPILNMSYAINKGGANIGEPSNLAVTLNGIDATITWTDNDLNTIPPSAFSKSVLVRKIGSAPTTPTDGTLVVTETVKNTYKTIGYVDSGLTEGETYYYKVFSYSDSGGITYGESKHIQPILDRPDINAYTQTSGESIGHNNIHGICISDDGKHIYLGQGGSGNMFYHYVSSGDLSTYSTTATASKTGIDTRGMFYKDPKQLYAIRESYSNIYSISMSTDYELSTATITTPSIAITDNKKCGCEFSPDGVYFYRSYWEGGKIIQYTLSTPWDLSTASETYTLNTSFSNVPYDIRFSPTGKKVFVGTRGTLGTTQGIYQLSCSTPYMLSTATYNNKYLSSGGYDVTFDITHDGMIYMVNMYTNYIYQYDAS